MQATLLLIDDDAAVRRQIAEAFPLMEGADCAVIDFADGAEALAYLDGQPDHSLPDVVLLDRHLPGLSGDEIIRTLKGSERLRHMPVMFLTGLTDPADLVEGLTVLGAEAYIKKPFDLDELMAQVKVLLRLKRAEDRQRDLEHSRFFSAVEFGSADPLGVLRHAWDEIDRDLGRAGVAAGENPAGAEALERVEAHLARVRRYLELELNPEPPSFLRPVALLHLLEGLCPLGPAQQAMARWRVLVNAKELRDDVLRPALAWLAAPAGTAPGVTISRMGGRVSLELSTPAGVAPVADALPDAEETYDLALTLARRVAERYGGALSCERAAAGRRCRLTLPPAEAHGRETQAGGGTGIAAVLSRPAQSALVRSPLPAGGEAYEEVFESLRGSRFFARIAPALLHTVLERGVLAELPQGETLIHQGSRDSTTLYFLLGGALDVYSDGNYIVSYTAPGEAIGEIAALGNVPRTADVVATADCRLLEVDKAGLDAIRRSDPERYIQFLELVALYLGEKVGMATRRLHTYESMVLKTEELRSRSAEMERQVHDKLRQIVLYSHVLESSQDGIVITDAEGRVLTANPAARALLAAGELAPADSLFDRMPCVRELAGNATGALPRASRRECEIATAEGGRLPVEITLAPVKEQGRATALAVFMRDIRDNKRLLASLERSRNALAEYSQGLEHLVERRTGELKANQQLLQTVVDNVPYLINVKNVDGTYRMVNRRFAEAHGLKTQELVGRRAGNLPSLQPEDVDTLERMDAAALQGEQAELPELYTRAPNGDVVVTHVYKVPFRDAGGAITGVIGIAEDITERKRIEQELRDFNRQLSEANDRLQQETVEKARALRKLQETQGHLLQSEKMVALGQLAAGVAHEINNPIGFINSNLRTLSEYFGYLQELLRAYLELERIVGWEDARAAAMLGEIGRLKGEMDYEFIVEDSPTLIADSLEGAGRVVSIVRNLKEFSRADQGQKQWADVNQGIESTLRVIWNELKYKVTLDKQLGDLPEIECYPQQLNQVFLNLLVNAAQAIGEQGVISIRTAATPEGVTVAIEDTGCGIGPEHLAHIFEPFYTTKPVGKGTGLGLSLVYNIVKKHHGTIDVESEPGRGTRFTLRLPLRFDDDHDTEEAA